jgi:Flp pilus assembly protein TadD
MRRLAACIMMAAALWLPPSHAEPYETDPDLAARDEDYAAGKKAVDAKQWTEAAQRFERTARRYPEHADLQNMLGYTYRNLKNYDLAFLHYRRAIELDPRHRGAHEYIGETYLLVGDVASARKHAKALREICLLPCDELADLERAIAQYEKGKPS